MSSVLSTHFFQLNLDIAYLINGTELHFMCVVIASTCIEVIIGLHVCELSVNSV